MNIAKPNLKKYPYRGVLEQIANECDKTRNAIYMAFHRGNPVIRKRFNEIVEDRVHELSKDPASRLIDTN